MKNFAVVEAGSVREVIAPLTIDGKEIPMEERYPADMVARMIEIPEGQDVKPGDAYRMGEFVSAQLEVPPAPQAADVLGLRDVYLREALTRIGPLQDAVDLDEATAKESAALTAWKRYRIDLNRIDQQPGFPAEVVWPTKPE